MKPELGSTVGPVTISYSHHFSNHLTNHTINYFTIKFNWDCEIFIISHLWNERWRLTFFVRWKCETNSWNEKQSHQSFYLESTSAKKRNVSALMKVNQFFFIHQQQLDHQTMPTTVSHSHTFSIWSLILNFIQAFRQDFHVISANNPLFYKVLYYI